MRILDFEIVSHNGLVDDSDFDNYSTGIPKLDTFLFAELDKMEKGNRTAMSVVYLEDEIVGLFSLSAAQVTTRQTSNVFDHNFGDANQYFTSLPLISLDHISVNKKYQYDPAKNKDEQFGVGKSLLYIIFEIIVSMKSIYNIAVAGLIVHALTSAEAESWYEDRGFEYLDEFEEKTPKDTSKMIIGYKMIEKAYFEANNKRANE